MELYDGDDEWFICIAISALGKQIQWSAMQNKQIPP